jgi:hypothetical protein
MTLLFMDSFDHYTTAFADEKYTSVSNFTISAGNGRNSTSSCRFTSAGNASKTLGVNASTLIAGFAFKASTLIAGTLIDFQDSSTVQAQLYLNSDGTLAIRRGASTTLGTSSNSIATGQYYYIEVKIAFNSSTGTAEIKVNGVSWLSLTGQNTISTANAYANVARILGINAATRDFDDYYVCDSQGSVNKDFLGDVRIEAILPTGAGSSAEWTPSTGSNYENVDDSYPDDDSTYNYTTASGNIDTFAFGDLVTTSGGIYAVQLNIYARKTDAGTKLLRGVYTRSSENVLDNQFSLNTTYAYFRQILEEDPDADDVWTIANVNSAEWGYKSDS